MGTVGGIHDRRFKIGLIGIADPEIVRNVKEHKAPYVLVEPIRGAELDNTVVVQSQSHIYGQGL